MATSPTTEQQKLVAELIAEFKDDRELSEDIVVFMKSEAGSYTSELYDGVKKIKIQLQPSVQNVNVGQAKRQNSRQSQSLSQTSRQTQQAQVTPPETLPKMVDLFDVLTLLDEKERHNLLNKLPDYDEIKDNSDLAWKVSQLPYRNAKDSIPNEIFEPITTKLNLPAQTNSTPQRDFVPKRSEPRMLSNFRYLETLQNQEQIAKFVEEQRQTFVEALQQSMDESMYRESGDFPDKYIDFEPIMKRLKYNNEKAYNQLMTLKTDPVVLSAATKGTPINDFQIPKVIASAEAAAKARAAAAAGGAKTSKKPKQKTSGTQ